MSPISDEAEAILAAVQRAIEASTVRAVAASIGIPHSTLYGWVTGRRLPTVADLALLEAWLMGEDR